MQTTADFLDALQAKLGARSDYGLVKLTGWSKQQISGYRMMHHTFDDASALKVADWLQLDAGYVIACMGVQRSKRDDVRAAWSELARKAASIAAGVMIVYGLVPLLYYGNDAGAIAASPMYIMLNHAQLALWFALQLLLVAWAFDDDAERRTFAPSNAPVSP